MTSFPRHRLCLIGFGALLFLGSCSSAPRPASSATANLPAFTLQTPIDEIAADPRGKAVLERDLPGLMASPKYQMFSGMSLSDLAPLSGGRLTPDKLQKVQTDLAALPGTGTNQ